MPEETSAASAAEPTSAPSGLLSALGWLAGSIGLTGVFYASGFVIETSYQSLLGVEIIDPANRIYLRSAAGFWLALPNSLLAFAGDLIEISKKHELLVGLAALMLASLLTLVLALGKAKALSGLQAVRSILGRWLGPLIVVFALLSLVYFDLPLVRMTNFLVEGSVASEADPTNYIESFRKKLWCAHRMLAGCTVRSEEAQAQLDGELFLHFVVTVSLILGCVSLGRGSRSIFINLVLGASILALAAGLFAFYGVTHRSFERSKSATVFYEREQAIDGILLSRDTKTLTLLPITQDEPVELPIDKVGKITSFSGPVDIFIFQREKGPVKAICMPQQDGGFKGFDLTLLRKFELYDKEATTCTSDKKTGELRSVSIEYSGPFKSEEISGFILAETDETLYLFVSSPIGQIWELKKSRVTLVEVGGMDDLLFRAPRKPARVAVPTP